MSNKHFNVKEANELIPLINEELCHLKNLQSDFDHKLQQLNRVKLQLKEHVQTETSSLFLMESELEFLEIQAQIHVTNINNTGALLKGIDPGLVDFPSIKNNETILLCWKEGESEISYYHSETEGFAGRKPLSDDDKA
ncbi:DUF2203 domain-containing protein [Salipaludibacillus sp. LMS25]|jgi:hypothetical protein|uniref:DUF2203 domain-containing protein n=1 Tax=Salipaludibacillus sp. LMS25 TaxID=2924031 RepID=UPI0020D1B06C|nr:DUF2203 domain-containing protein [Salipaludibacillus sp. LMS25]UTR14762.1 DUF2203 domain-containing protein [Salipaludibacillus sp. LMS25]